MMCWEEEERNDRLADDDDRHIPLFSQAVNTSEKLDFSIPGGVHCMADANVGVFS